MRFSYSMLLVAGFALAAMSLSGCGSSSDSVAIPEQAGTHDDHDHEAGDHEGHADSGHDHSGWWCVEHGVPEEECALCDTRLVADFKAKGDWCDEHNRPESQCFTCEPQRFDRFAARYEAKFGEQPPKPTE
jgi:hypothetical protein